MGRTCPIREEMDGKVFISHQMWYFSLWCCFCKINFPQVYLDLTCKHLCFRPRNRYKLEKWKYQDTKNDSTDDDDSQSIFVFVKIIIATVIKLISFKKSSLVLNAVPFFTVENGKSEKETKTLALNKENQEELSRSNRAQNTSVPRTQEVYITQVSEEFEGRVSKNLSKECSRAESRILGVLSWLDEFVLIPIVQGHSGFAPETSQNTQQGEIQGAIEDSSQSDPHLEAKVSHTQSTQSSGPDDGYDSVYVSLIKMGHTLFRLPQMKLVPEEWPFLSQHSCEACSQTIPQQRTGTQLAETREWMSTTPRVILILKIEPLSARLHKILAQMTATTVPR